MNWFTEHDQDRPYYSHIVVKDISMTIFWKWGDIMSMDRFLARIVAPISVAIAIAVTFVTFAGYWA